MSIQKIIHQCWYQGEESLPIKYHSNVQSVKDKNPNWDYIFWDEKKIQALMSIMDESIQKKYASFQLLHQKIDFARYCILFVYGGVSVDVDCVALKGFDTLQDLGGYSPLGEPDVIVSKSSNGRFINNATILAPAQSAFLKYLIDSIKTDCLYTNESLCVANTTGPIAFTKFVNEYKGVIGILPSKYFEPCSGNDPYCKIPPDAILDHQHEKSWVNPVFTKVEKGYYWAKHYKTILLVLLLVVIFIIIIVKK